MADRVEVFTLVTPAGTPISAPMVHDMRINPGVVAGLEIIIPPGPSGLMGVRITHAGETIIPYRGADWLVTDDEKIAWPLTDYPDAGAWGARIYNDDIYEHAIVVRFLVDELPLRPGGIPPPLDIAPGGDAEPEDDGTDDDLIGDVAGSLSTVGSDLP